MNRFKSSRILQHPCDCCFTLNSIFDESHLTEILQHYAHIYILHLLKPQKRYGGHHVAQSPSPNTHRPLSSGTALGPPIFRPRSGPLRSGATPARPARTTRASLSCPTATTTCMRTCTLCRCPRLPPMAVVPRPGRPRAQAAPGPLTRARPVSSSSCPAPS